MTTPTEQGSDDIGKKISEILNSMVDQVNHYFEETYSKVGSALEKPVEWLKHVDPDGSSIAASSQALYWSQQAAKLDVSAVTASFDGFKVDESGIYLMGAKVYEFPWVSALEERFGTASASASKLKTLQEDMPSIKGDIRNVKGEIVGAKGEINDVKEDVVIIKGDVSGVKGLANNLNGKVSTLREKQTVYQRQKVGNAGKWATKSWVEDRLRRGTTVANRIREVAPVAETGRDVEHLAQRVAELETAIGR
ncbi:hypothetical protein ACFY5F_06670 [Streptomyces sp. NPDC013161]|uniref:hypothetical protein n=1 Tax=Streptomyces sp. NPDC013161 TaxID=3364862 RepID=UPI0036A24958